MAKINTLNYQTVAAWNGSQDLFVVEQPDGTKVATPAMVKQFIEAGDFEATGEITDGHGNILKDMAKSADVSTALASKQDTLTFDNAPTENSGNPVKSGGLYPLTSSSTVSGTNVSLFRFGKLRVLNSNRCTYEDLKTFYSNLPLTDKPTSLRFSVMVRTSNDNKYMTTPFVYIGTTGLNAMHFAAYNANGVEGQVGNTDRLIGELVYTVE